MDGEAQDFVIDEDGDLVLSQMPEDDAGVNTFTLSEGHVVAVVTQGPMGELSVQVYGPPTKQLVAALHSAMRGLMHALKQCN